MALYFSKICEPQMPNPNGWKWMRAKEKSGRYGKKVIEASGLHKEIQFNQSLPLWPKSLTVSNSSCRTEWNSKFARILQKRGQGLRFEGVSWGKRNAKESVVRCKKNQSSHVQKICTQNTTGKETTLRSIFSHETSCPYIAKRRELVKKWLAFKFHSVSR